MKKSKHNPGKGHKTTKGATQSGGNLKFPKASQSITVAPTKDTMAMNIGDHMGGKNPFGPAQPMMASGNGAPKKFKETR